jgi:hypothetical protein
MASTILLMNVYAILGSSVSPPPRRTAALSDRRLVGRSRVIR